MDTYSRDRIDELMHSTDPLDRIIFNYGLEDDRGRKLTDELHELFDPLRKDAERWRKLLAQMNGNTVIEFDRHDVMPAVIDTADELTDFVDALT